jgi:hypothetical protein
MNILASNSKRVNIRVFFLFFLSFCFSYTSLFLTAEGLIERSTVQ